MLVYRAPVACRAWRAGVPFWISRAPIVAAMVCRAPAVCRAGMSCVIYGDDGDNDDEEDDDSEDES